VNAANNISTLNNSNDVPNVMGNIGGISGHNIGVTKPQV